MLLSHSPVDKRWQPPSSLLLLALLWGGSCRSQGCKAAGCECERACACAHVCMCVSVRARGLPAAGPPTAPHPPPPARRPRPSLAGCAPGRCAAAALPPRWEATPGAPRVQRPRAAAPAPPGGGEARGWYGRQKSPSPQPVLRRDGQRALKCVTAAASFWPGPGTQRASERRPRTPQLEGEAAVPGPAPFLGHRSPFSRPGAPAPDRGSWSRGCGFSSGSQ